MKRINKSILFFAVLLSLASCTDRLNIDPPASLTQKQASDDPDKLVIAAYAELGNDHYDAPFSLWPYGNVRSDDAYKGGSGTGDIQNFHFYEISKNISADFGEPDRLWFQSYIGISRANTALRLLNGLSVSEFPNKNARIAEMRFLRGHFYFLLKILFKSIPYIDENVAAEDYGTISNVALTNDALWGKIAADFETAYNNLPATQSEKGRANKYSAAAYLAKVRLYKAYRQDDQNNITSIDASDLNEVLKYTQEVLNSPAQLETDFAYNFLPGNYENGNEALFSIQYSKGDGTKFGRVNFGDLLSVPQGLGCCDFHKPSQNLVNSFKTKDGLPEFDSYNNEIYDATLDKVDPRLYHTVAMPDLPYKYNTNFIYKKEWVRNPGVYGLFASLKENVDPTCDCFVKTMTPFYPNSKNRIVIRFADVLLMRAEALIELNQEVEALPLINEVRARAKSSTGLIPYATNIDIALYQAGAGWDQEFARKALRWERRLELAMEGNRFFDLVRWGITDQVINSYYQTEEPRRNELFTGAGFTKNKNEYLPIPQQQINFSKGLYKQNYGW